MFMTVIVVVIALFIGLFANRFIRSRSRGDDEDSGYSLSDLMSPLETLAVLLLAFVLVVAAESFDSAESAAQAEADAVDNLYEVASFAPDPQKQQLQASIVCYVRAIKASEWPIMTGGDISPVADSWTDGFTRTFAGLTERPYFEPLVEADQERSSARRERLAQAQPSVPAYVYWFMAVVLGVTIIGFAFALPRRNNVFHIITLGVLTLLFAVSLTLIQDIDRPFTGTVHVDSEELTITQQHITALYTGSYSPASLPCDQQGRPK
ncbi:MAG: DUF4239 domain-containing protein [Streptosporangiales bacterium]|nr:DUF4239 domain-containing protein [Streptosporangiales bacterium]